MKCWEGIRERPGYVLVPFPQVGRSETSLLIRGNKSPVKEKGHCFQKGIRQTHYWVVQAFIDWANL